jgi:hypothetical protein
MNIIIFSDINNCYGFGREAGSYRVASELRIHGFTVQVVEFFGDLTLQEIQLIANKFTDDKTLMVAFATTHYAKNDTIIYENQIDKFVDRINHYHNCDCFPHSIEWLDSFKQIFLDINPNIKFVAGGERAMTANRDLYNLDYWILGQADEALPALANAIEYDEPMPHVIYGDRDYPFTGFQYSNIRWTDNDLIFQGEHLPIEIARGCIFNCSFCSYKKSHEIKNLATLKSELIYNYENFDTTGYMIMDPTFNATIKKTEELCNMFKTLPFQIEWSGFARLDIFANHPEMREMLLESGAKAVQFGIESLNDETIVAIKKGLPSSQTKELLYFLDEKWHRKIITGSFFILGLPYETEEQFYNNMEWALQEDCPLHSISIGILSIRKYREDMEDMINFSDISKNLGKYNYSQDTKHWVNETNGLSRENCFNIMTDFTRNTNYMDRNFIDFNFYSRMRNLGYTFDELWNMKKDYGESFDTSNVIKDAMKVEYLNKLLK